MYCRLCFFRILCDPFYSLFLYHIKAILSINKTRKIFFFERYAGLDHQKKEIGTHTQKHSQPFMLFPRANQVFYMIRFSAAKLAVHHNIYFKCLHQ